MVPSDGNYADVAAEFASVQRMLDVAERLIRIADALLDHANTIVVAAERRTYEASIRVPDRGSVNQTD
jgi:hypothetical protein